MFIAKNNDLIIMSASTKEEVLQEDESINDYQEVEETDNDL